MRTTAFTTVETVSTSSEAEHAIASLRHAGLHPADLAVAAPLALPGKMTKFPIEVPSEEAGLAGEVLKQTSAFET